MTKPTQANHQTPYQMLIAAEEKERGTFEDIVYLLLVVATTAAIWQLGHQPVTFADLGAKQAAQKASAILQS